ncbi:MAG: Ig-like domain-containing protein [Myxococcota bacterium]
MRFGLVGHPWVLCIAFIACSEDPKTDTDGGTTPADDGDADTDADADSDTDTDSDADADCTATIVAVDPADGATLVPLDAEVTVSFDAAITATDPLSIDVSGATGTVALAGDGLSATWTGALDPDTAYTVNANVCTDTSSTTFTTLPPSIDPSTVEGNTYAIAWDDLNITEPQNSVAIELLIQVDAILAQVLAIDPVTLLADAAATIGTDDGTGLLEPDCAIATVQTADFSLNPYFSIDGTISITIDSAGTAVDIEDFQLLARVSEDSSALEDVRISGLIATEQINPPGVECANPALSILAPTCVPCTTSASGDCMLFEANAAVAPVVAGVDIAGTCGL